MDVYPLVLTVPDLFRVRIRIPFAFREGLSRIFTCGTSCSLVQLNDIITANMMVAAGLPVIIGLVNYSLRTTSVS